MPTEVDALALVRATRTGVDRPTLRTRFLTMNTTLKIAAVAVLTLVVGIGVVELRPSSDQIGPASAPTPSPSPLVWSPASIEQDWPAPVREEPVGDPTIIPFADGYLDGRQDTGDYDLPWIDILGVRDDICNPSGACLDLAGPLTGPVVPCDPWIAYGLVFDTDLDGVADVRLGMDRVPTELAGWKDTPSHTRTRAWRTDLRTGVTAYGEAGVSIADGGIPGAGDTFVKLYPHRYLADDYLTDDGSFPGPTNAYGVPTYLAIPGRFYAWASQIQDGQVVATDYAPDIGWLVKP
jgi:hypothetical protein